MELKSKDQRGSLSEQERRKRGKMLSPTPCRDGGLDVLPATFNFLKTSPRYTLPELISLRLSHFSSVHRSYSEHVQLIPQSLSHTLDSPFIKV